MIINKKIPKTLKLKSGTRNISSKPIIFAILFILTFNTFILAQVAISDTTLEDEDLYNAWLNNNNKDSAWNTISPNQKFNLLNHIKQQGPEAQTTLYDIWNDIKSPILANNDFTNQNLNDFLSIVQVEKYYDTLSEIIQKENELPNFKLDIPKDLVIKSITYQNGQIVIETERSGIPIPGPDGTATESDLYRIPLKGLPESLTKLDIKKINGVPKAIYHNGEGRFTVLEPGYYLQDTLARESTHISGGLGDSLYDDNKFDVYKSNDNPNLNDEYIGTISFGKTEKAIFMVGTPDPVGNNKWKSGIHIWAEGHLGERDIDGNTIRPEIIKYDKDGSILYRVSPNPELKNYAFISEIESKSDISEGIYNFYGNHISNPYRTALVSKSINGIIDHTGNYDGPGNVIHVTKTDPSNPESGITINADQSAANNFVFNIGRNVELAESQEITYQFIKGKGYVPRTGYNSRYQDGNDVIRVNYVERNPAEDENEDVESGQTTIQPPPEPKPDPISEGGGTVVSTRPETGSSSGTTSTTQGGFDPSIHQNLFGDGKQIIPEVIKAIPETKPIPIKTTTPPTTTTPTTTPDTTPPTTTPPTTTEPETTGPISRSPSGPTDIIITPDDQGQPTTTTIKPFNPTNRAGATETPEYKATIKEYGSRPEEFKKLTQSKRELALRNIEDFIEGFKTLTIDQQADYLSQTDDDGKFLIPNNKEITRDDRSDIFHSLGQRKIEVLKKFSSDSFNNYPDEYLKGLYKWGEGEYSGLKDFNLNDPNNEMKLDGMKLVGKNGGYLNFGEGDDRLSPFISKIEYNDGVFKATLGNNIELSFEEGTPAKNGGFYNPDGKLVGGAKALNTIFEIKSDQKAKKLSISFDIDENGKSFSEIKILKTSDKDAVGLRFIDIDGKNYFIDVNKDNWNNVEGGIDATIRIDENNIISAKSAHLKTENHGNYKFSNRESSYLLGNVFNEPGAGTQDFESRLTKILGPLVKQRVLDKTLEIFGIPDGETIKAIASGISANDFITKFTGLQSAVGIILDEEGLGTETLDDIFPSRLSNSAELLGEIALDLGVYAYLGDTGLLQGQGGLVGPAIGEVLPIALQQLAHPPYQDYLDTDKSFLYINNNYNEFEKENLVEIIASGGYMALDVGDVKGTLNKLVVNNFLHETNENGVSNGEITYVKNGGLILGFKGDKFVDTKGNVIDAIRHPSFYSRAKKPIAEIGNLQSDENTHFVLNKNGRYMEFFRSDGRVRLTNGAELFLEGDRFGTYGVVIKGGGVEFRNTLKDLNGYPQPDDATMNFIVDPKLIRSTGGGGFFSSLAESFVGAKKALQTVRSQASKTTRGLANEIDNSVYSKISTMVEKEYGGNVNAFYRQINSANAIISATTSLAESDRILSSLFPGQNAQETRDMVYLISNDAAYANTLKSYANLNGRVEPGSASSGLTNKGFYYGNTKIPNQDPRIATYLLSSAYRDPPASKTITFTQGEAESTKPIDKRDYNIRTRLQNEFSNTPVTQQRSATIRQPSRTSSTYQQPKQSQYCRDGTCFIIQQ